jgi:hypothetical protein
MRISLCWTDVRWTPWRLQRPKAVVKKAKLLLETIGKQSEGTGVVGGQVMLLLSKCRSSPFKQAKKFLLGQGVPERKIFPKGASLPSFEVRLRSSGSHAFGM